MIEKGFVGKSPTKQKRGLPSRFPVQHEVERIEHGFGCVRLWDEVLNARAYGFCDSAV